MSGHDQIKYFFKHIDLVLKCRIFSIKLLEFDICDIEVFSFPKFALYFSCIHLVDIVVANALMTVKPGIFTKFTNFPCDVHLLLDILAGRSKQRSKSHTKRSPKLESTFWKCNFNSFDELFDGFFEFLWAKSQSHTGFNITFDIQLFKAFRENKRSRE